MKAKPPPPRSAPADELRIVEREGAVRFDVLVVPRSSRDAIGPIVGAAIKVAVRAPPVDGEANAALVALLSKTLGVARKSVRVVAGQTGRRKTVEVRGASRADVLGLATFSRGACASRR